MPYYILYTIVMLLYVAMWQSSSYRYSCIIIAITFCFFKENVSEKGKMSHTVGQKKTKQSQQSPPSSCCWDWNLATHFWTQRRSLLHFHPVAVAHCGAGRLVTFFCSWNMLKPGGGCNLPLWNLYRRKFRSQTSDNMDRWKSRGGKSQ